MGVSCAVAPSQARKDELTICSVSFRSSAYLSLSYELTRKLNLDDPIVRWIVVENTPEGEADRLGADDQRFDVRPGVDPPPPRSGRASYHHGAALNSGLKDITSRFVLILDPDFFIIQKDWVRRVVAHMKRRRLAFFGAPWHPRWYTKWRYFPCAHCMLVDLSRPGVGDLDFSPDITDAASGRRYHSPFLRGLERTLASGERWWTLLRAIRKLRLLLAEDRNRRSIIGSSRDTGIRIFERFSGAPGIRSETLQPVYRPHVDPLLPSLLEKDGGIRWNLRNTLELFRQDSLRFVPKRRRYWSRRSFRDFGLPDLRELGWEEFMWRGRPFGFHVRRAKKSEVELERDLELARGVTQRLSGWSASG